MNLVYDVHNKLLEKHKLNGKGKNLIVHNQLMHSHLNIRTKQHLQGYGSKLIQISALFITSFLFQAIQYNTDDSLKVHNSNITT